MKDFIAMLLGLTGVFLAVYIPSTIFLSIKKILNNGNTTAKKDESVRQLEKFKSDYYNRF